MPLCGQLRCFLARMAPLPRGWHRCAVTASDAEHSCARIMVTGELFTSVLSCVEHKIRALFEIEGPQSRMPKVQIIIVFYCTIILEIDGFATIGSHQRTTLFIHRVNRWSDTSTSARVSVAPSPQRVSH